MADDTTSGTTSSSGSFQGSGGREGGRRQGGNREGGNREPGGFRIRLSDNEMRAARAVQDAFRLRSTVAALGFSIRTVAQLLEDGKLDELVAEQRAQAGNRGDRRGGERGERRSERPSGPRVDPFARPSKPAPAPAVSEDTVPGDETVPADEIGAADESLPAEESAPAAEASAPEASVEDATAGSEA